MSNVMMNSLENEKQPWWEGLNMDIPAQSHTNKCTVYLLESGSNAEEFQII